MIGAVARFPEARTFIVATEHGIVHQMKQKWPGKEFVIADGCIGCRMHCPYMKMIDLVMLRDTLRRGKHEIVVPADVADGARRVQVLRLPSERGAAPRRAPSATCQA